MRRGIQGEPRIIILRIGGTFKKAVQAAVIQGISLNRLVQQAIEKEVGAAADGTRC